MKRQMNQNQTIIYFEGQPVLLLRSSRRTIGLEIKRDMRVLVRAPLRMKEQDILRFLKTKQAWLNTHMERLRTQAQESAPAVPFTEAELAELTMRAKENLPPRVEFFAQRMGVSYKRITVRHQLTRFGSCTEQGNLSFNCLLMAMPREICDYVIVHELCHRQQMNHSPAFWRAVESVLPDYKERRLWLQQHGGGLIARLRKMRK
jgi:predicted metal-dependent hydrolase